MPEKPEGLRGHLGALAQRIYPNLDERAFTRNRRKLRKSVLAGHDLATMPHGPIVNNLPPHVVVVPSEGSDFPTWGPALGNFYFEVAGNLTDLVGSPSVSVFHIASGTPVQEWHRALLAYLIDSGATHLITHIESDPGSGGASFTWDSFMELADRHWGGVVLGVMFDSSYRFTTFQSRVLARMSSRFMVVDICMPMNDTMKKGRVEVGPVNRPMSAETLRLIAERVTITPKAHDVSFIGVLYPYRLEIVEKLRTYGLTVAVNPHRSDAQLDTAASRANQPSWLDYMAGLASSKATINFSQSSAGPFQQLKWRVIEAGLANTFLFTDDRDRTRLFWNQDSYGYFTEPESLPSVVETWFESEHGLVSASNAFHDRAVEISKTQFWGAIEQGLVLRGLPSISKTLLNY